MFTCFNAGRIPYVPHLKANIFVKRKCKEYVDRRSKILCTAREGISVTLELSYQWVKKWDLFFLFLWGCLLVPYFACPYNLQICAWNLSSKARASLYSTSCTILEKMYLPGPGFKPTALATVPTSHATTTQKKKYFYGSHMHDIG